ncbi:MAG: ABC transporter permease [Bacteroidetes bacterium]|nr:ABC transporter permease [Bacteroidota bacterium]MBU1422997.1 ABC transporter permease [Bacteroidota bacterium]MBU2472287.1 ABC transporter permease [Bacteroidota bacterium]MBU2635920.1 ABC transporter permease [Bacteroidota bacterium]
MHKFFETIFSEVKESFLMAINAIRVNKLRSILTLLGIAVGVFSIIAVMTAMGVLVNSVESGMTMLGSHTFQVQRFPAFQMGDGSRVKYRNRKKITLQHGMAVKQHASLAEAVGLEAWEYGKVVKSVKGVSTNPNVQLAGEDIEGFVTNNWSISEGRLYTEDELASGRNIAVIGQDVVTKLFPKSDPLGESIRIDGQLYSVIGVIEKKGQLLGGSQDNFIVIPLNTFFRVYGKERDLHIMVQAKNPEVYEDCIEQVRGILRAARQVPPGGEDDFHIFSNESLIQQFNDVTYYVRLGIMLISMIALIAAGVGIMNIMLVSVTERTREIGIRKAVGARKSNILTQFILEAIILSEVGGVIGVLLGVLGGNIAALLMSVPPIIPYDWAIIGLVVCSLVGLVFGVYPAWKAANLDPIDALRYE